VADLTVRLIRVAFGQQFKAKTDSRGNYFHAGLSEGEYECLSAKTAICLSSAPTHSGPFRHADRKGLSRAAS
jgi:hypothetical protein